MSDFIRRHPTDIKLYDSFNRYDGASYNAAITNAENGNDCDPYPAFVNSLVLGVNGVVETIPISVEVQYNTSTRHISIFALEMMLLIYTS